MSVLAQKYISLDQDELLVLVELFCEYGPLEF